MSLIGIADDEPANRALLRAILEPQGYAIAEYPDGASILEALQTGPEISLVLLDVMMPGIDGIEVCRRIREELGLLTLPIIFVTALADRHSRVRGKAAGGDDFLSKPIEATELLARVTNLLKVRAYHELLAEQHTRLEAELTQTREQLLDAQRLALLGNIAGSVGHELGNITGVLKGTLSFLDECLSNKQPPSESDLELLRGAQRHLESHANNLLRLGRPAESSAQSQADLRLAIDTAIEMLVASGRTRHISLTRSLPSETILLPCHPTRVEQVVLNLIANAADAVRSQRSGEALVEIRLSFATSDLVILEVRDNGEGIPAEQLERVFDSYFTTKTRGTGLGLPVVKHIVEELGGDITLSSRVGEGTCVTVKLPSASSTLQSHEHQPDEQVS